MSAPPTADDVRRFRNQAIKLAEHASMVSCTLDDFPKQCREALEQCQEACPEVSEEMERLRELLTRAAVRRDEGPFRIDGMVCNTAHEAGIALTLMVGQRLWFATVQKGQAPGIREDVKARLEQFKGPKEKWGCVGHITAFDPKALTAPRFGGDPQGPGLRQHFGMEVSPGAVAELVAAIQREAAVAIDILGEGAPGDGLKGGGGPPEHNQFFHKAFSIFVSYPEYSADEAAKALGISRAGLYRHLERDATLKAAWQARKGRKSDLPRGYKDPETGDMDAWEGEEVG